MFAIFGYLGQRAYNWADARHSERVTCVAEAGAQNPQGEKKQGFWERVAEMKWSPMRSLSDEEYADMLRAKMLPIDAQIALVDEEIEKLRVEEAKMLKMEEANGVEDGPKK